MESRMQIFIDILKNQKNLILLENTVILIQSLVQNAPTHKQKISLKSELLSSGLEDAFLLIKERIEENNFYQLSDCTFQSLFNILAQEKQKQLEKSNDANNMSQFNKKNMNRQTYLENNDEEMNVTREKRKTDLVSLLMIREKAGVMQNMPTEQEILPSRGDHSTKGVSDETSTLKLNRQSTKKMSINFFAE